VLQRHQSQLQAELQEAHALLLEEQSIGQVLRQQLEKVDQEQEVSLAGGCAHHLAPWRC
jgi:flagellar hook-basal body complex protein FliE